MVKTKKGKYIIIDGLDGCGKGTQIEILKKLFSEREDVVFVREPGGTPSAEIIRNLIIGEDGNDFCCVTQLHLFCAARADLYRKVIAPALEKGMIIISDRGFTSTWAYQVYKEDDHLLKESFISSHKQLFNIAKPDVVIVLDLLPEISAERAKKDLSRELNHFDLKELGYYKTVREGFLNLKEVSDIRTYYIDASQSVGVVNDNLTKNIFSVISES